MYILTGNYNFSIEGAWLPVSFDHMWPCDELPPFSDVPQLSPSDSSDLENGRPKT